MLRFFIFAFITLSVDQISKYIIISNMSLGESIPVIRPVFYITYILNPGAAFGMLANRTTFFIIISLLVIIGVIVGYRYLPKERAWTRVATALVVGGALGNLIDRIRLGKVIDFLDFRVWPVFNLADTAIVTGALLLILEVWRTGNDEAKRVGTGAEN